MYSNVTKSIVGNGFDRYFFDFQQLFFGEDVMLYVILIVRINNKGVRETAITSFTLSIAADVDKFTRKASNLLLEIASPPKPI